MAEHAPDEVVATLSAKVELLSSQLLQLAQIIGQTAERAAVSQRELINYVSTQVAEVKGQLAGVAAAQADVDADVKLWQEQQSNGAAAAAMASPEQATEATTRRRGDRG